MISGLDHLGCKYYHIKNYRGTYGESYHTKAGYEPFDKR